MIIDIIIDYVYVSQTVNTMQTDVTDCYYSDHVSMFNNCLIDICHIFVKQWYIYDEYHIVHPDLCEILCKIKKYTNI